VTPRAPLRLGVIGSSAKENERRLPLHPEHLGRIPEELRGSITLEHGYGEHFRRSDADLAPYVAGFASRDAILADSEVVLLPKPQHEDLERMGQGNVLWGWPHCVQDPVLTQIAIDRRLTLIAFEVMNHWTIDGAVGLHVFHKNNELAGYCSVLQALELAGRKLEDVALFEINEAFAAQAVACARQLGLDEEIVNVYGSGISLGHPIAATGARMVTSAIHELRRRGGGIGVLSMCAGGGMGAAMVIEVS